MCALLSKEALRPLNKPLTLVNTKYLQQVMFYSIILICCPISATQTMHQPLKMLPSALFIFVTANVSNIWQRL